jgi:hypothetical protein
MSDPGDQLDLFGEPALPVFPYHDGHVPRVSSSPTSTAAAASMVPTLGTKQARVLELLRSRPDGLTDDDLERLTGWRHQTVSARRRELVLADLAVDSGRTRRTSSGRSATVWISRNGGSRNGNSHGGSPPVAPGDSVRVSGEPAVSD